MNKINDNTGKIYILRNSSLQPNVVKIGLTTRTSELRASELSKPTGVPNNFEVLYEEEVFDCKLAERLIHKELNNFRVLPNKEFFQIPLKLAVKTVFSICQSVNKLKITRIAIIINCDLITEENLILIREILKNHKGQKTNTHIHLIKEKRSETVLRLPENMNVSLSDDLIVNLNKVACVKEVIMQ